MWKFSGSAEGVESPIVATPTPRGAFCSPRESTFLELTTALDACGRLRCDLGRTQILSSGGVCWRPTVSRMKRDDR
jgi:hypothetical protein